MKLSKVFIDESGNTGDDLLNLDQPIFVLAALGVDKKAERLIRAAVANLRKKHRIQAGRELKGRSLTQGRGRRLIKEVVDAIFANGGIVFLELVEKRFNICTFLVDDLFDPVYNDNCDNSWTHFRPEKVEIAGIFYQRLSSGTLRIAADFLRTGQGVEVLFEHLLHDLRHARSRIPIVQIVSGARGHLSEWASVVASVSGENRDIDVGAGVMNSPNYISFFDIMNRIEFFYRRRREGARLIFDSSRQFDASFAAAFRRLKNARATVLYDRPGSIPFILGYRAIRDFATKKSDKSPLLQCSDLIATGIAQTVKSVGAGREVHDELGIQLLGLPGALQNFCNCVVSTQLMSSMASALSKALSRS